MGYDAHRLVIGRKLVLGGVEIAHPTGLLGHSDADVLVHAIIDALLGAVKLGDIGRIFPDSNPQYHNIASTELLHTVKILLSDADFQIINIDATIIAQQPKLAPHLPLMEANNARCLNIDASQINVKATTEEGMGFTGSCEGMAAHAVCLLNTILN